VCAQKVDEVVGQMARAQVRRSRWLQSERVGRRKWHGIEGSRRWNSAKMSSVRAIGERSGRVESAGAGAGEGEEMAVVPRRKGNDIGSTGAGPVGVGWCPRNSWVRSLGNKRGFGTLRSLVTLLFLRRRQHRVMGSFDMEWGKAFEGIVLHHHGVYVIWRFYVQMGDYTSKYVEERSDTVSSDPSTELEDAILYGASAICPQMTFDASLYRYNASNVTGLPNQTYKRKS
jgi:hypothetical protein